MVALPKHQSRLLDIPWDIRKAILEERLLSETPIRYIAALPFRCEPQVGIVPCPGNGQGLSPAILRVCKLLHSEGTAILYKNCLGIHVCQPADRSSKDQLRGIKDVSDLPEAVQHRISRVHLFFYSLPQYPITPYKVQYSVERLSKLLRALPAWDKLTFELCGPDLALDLADKSKFSYHALSPFADLRRRKTVHCVNIDPTMQSIIENDLIQDFCAFDLGTEHDSLKDEAKAIAQTQTFGSPQRSPTSSCLASLERELCYRINRHMHWTVSRLVVKRDIADFIEARRICRKRIETLLILRQRADAEEFHIDCQSQREDCLPTAREENMRNLIAGLPFDGMLSSFDAGEM